MGFQKEKKFQLQNKLDAFKDKGKTFVENLGEKRHEFIQKWEDKSREFINNFLELFGRDGSLVSSLYTKYLGLISHLFGLTFSTHF